jgi:hypothetical protein
MMQLRPQLLPETLSQQESGLWGEGSRSVLAADAEETTLQEGNGFGTQTSVPATKRRTGEKKKKKKKKKIINKEKTWARGGRDNF